MAFSQAPDCTRPSTWRPYRSKLCVNCHADCCRLPVEVHILEFVTMGFATHDELDDDIRLLVKRLKKENIIRLYDFKRDMATLAQRPNDDCRFLDSDRRCTIYDQRPQTCRRFPEIGPRSNFCPCVPKN